MIETVASKLTPTRRKVIHEHFIALMGRDYFARVHGGILGIEPGGIGEDLFEFATELGATDEEAFGILERYGFSKNGKEGPKIKAARDIIKKFMT